MGYPLIVLSHRRREFLETTLASLAENLKGADRVIVVDDSGDPEHHRWLADQDIWYIPTSVTCGKGYLTAMQRVWDTALDQVDILSVDYAVIWEEDFVLNEPVSLDDMACVLDENPMLAQLNLQRQPVYRIERRFGYMQSHQRRGYDLSSRITADIPWVRRSRPFTTNPGLVRRAVLEVDWPTREEADQVAGGAEPAMSQKLEHMGFCFGWLGHPNHPHTHHVGTEMKTGKGY